MGILPPFSLRVGTGHQELFLVYTITLWEGFSFLALWGWLFEQW